MYSSRRERNANRRKCNSVYRRAWDWLIDSNWIPFSIIGPRCLHSCLADNIVVPHVVSPIYTMAMRDLVVCASKIEPAEKRQLEKLIGYMGGMYTNSFMDKVTHLVTEDIFTNKYEVSWPSVAAVEVAQMCNDMYCEFQLCNRWPRRVVSRSWSRHGWQMCGRVAAATMCWPPIQKNSGVMCCRRSTTNASHPPAWRWPSKTRWKNW